MSDASPHTAPRTPRESPPREAIGYQPEAPATDAPPVTSASRQPALARRAREDSVRSHSLPLTAVRTLAVLSALAVASTHAADPEPRLAVELGQGVTLDLVLI